jgi:hypothetical protein
MPNSAPFSLNRSGMLLALISAAFAGEAGAAAGRVDFTFGNVTVSSADGRERPLARGAELDNGDTVRTADGRAQIRFSDGAYVSLQPNSEFAIKDYRYEGRTDGNERGFFALAKGAMRTVTGLVGRVNRNRYQISTPTATVGIRGTGGVIQVLNDGSTLVVGTSGIWSLTNPAGTIDVPAGVSALAPATPESPPQQTTQQPATGPDPIQPQPVVFAQGNDRDASGAPVGITTFQPLLTGTGYAAVTAFGGGAGVQLDGGEGSSFNDVKGIFNGAGQLTEVSDAFGSFYRLEAGGAHGLRPDGSPDFGSDGVLAWGRWVGPVTASAFEGSTATLGPDEGFHYVIGMPTTTLPTEVRATYSLLGATSPTYIGGLTAPGKVLSGQLTVDFFSGSFSVQLGNFVVAMPDATYRLDGQGSNSFTGGPGFTLFPTVTSAACVSACSASVNGFFSGASAERAGINYHINNFNTNPSKDIVGAAAFTKSGTGPLPPAQ